MTTPTFSPALSDSEVHFLTRWAYDEWHFTEGRGPAKTLQVRSGVIPAAMGEVLAAAMPSSVVTEIMGGSLPPAGPVEWPWSDPEDFRLRLVQAREINRRKRTIEDGGS